MTASTTQRLLAGGALLLVLTAGNTAARAQAPADTTPAATTPSDTTTPADTTPTDTTPSDPNAPAPASPKKRSRFRIGPEVGVYLPTSAKARDQFGSTWLTLGLGLGNIGRITPQGQTTFDLQVLYQTRNGNHAFLAPVGIGYRVAVSQSGTNTVYVGATADLLLADLRSGDYDVHSGLRTGFGGSALAGINFGDSGYLEARYLAATHIKGFDLSGLNVTAGYRF